MDNDGQHLSSVSIGEHSSNHICRHQGISCAAAMASPRVGSDDVW